MQRTARQSLRHIDRDGDKLKSDDPTCRQFSSPAHHRSRTANPSRKCQSPKTTPRTKLPTSSNFNPLNPKPRTLTPNAKFSKPPPPWNKIASNHLHTHHHATTLPTSNPNSSNSTHSLPLPTPIQLHPLTTNQRTIRQSNSCSRNETHDAAEVTATPRNATPERARGQRAE